MKIAINIKDENLVTEKNSSVTRIKFLKCKDSFSISPMRQFKEKIGN